MVRRSINLLSATVLAAASMMAGTVQMTWVGVGNDPTYDGYYVGPYQADIGGSLTPTLVYCDDFNDQVNTNGWTAYVTTSPFANSTVSTNLQNTVVEQLGGPTPTCTNLQGSEEDYQEIAYLTTQYATNTQDWAGIATAIWSFFGQGHAPVVSGAISDPTSTAYWLNQAALHYTSINTAGITIYTPTLNSPSQEFVTYTSAPEPSTFAIFSLGTALLAFAVFRPRRKASSR